MGKKILSTWGHVFWTKPPELAMELSYWGWNGANDHISNWMDFPIFISHIRANDKIHRSKVLYLCAPSMQFRLWIVYYDYSMALGYLLKRTTALAKIRETRLCGFCVVSHLIRTFPGLPQGCFHMRLDSVRRQWQMYWAVFSVSWRGWTVFWGENNLPS